MSFHTELEDDRQRESSLVREVSDKMVCSACRCTFNNREEQVNIDLWGVFCTISMRRHWSTARFVFQSQMEHYKLDWHRFNLRQKMLGMPPVTAEEFERKTGAGEENHRSPAHICQGLEQLIDFQLLIYRRHVEHLGLGVRFRGRRLG